MPSSIWTNVTCCRFQAFARATWNRKCLLCEIEVIPICKNCSCGYSLSVLHHFDWCVYLNPQHLAHRPKETDSCSIIRRLGSHYQGWQQSGCIFSMRVCMKQTFPLISLSGLWLRSGLLIDYDGAWKSQTTETGWAWGASRQRDVSSP